MFYFFQLKKRPDNTKQLPRRYGKDQINQQLINLLGFNKSIDKEELIMCSDRVKDRQKALNIIKVREDIIKTKRKNTICFTYQ